MREQVLVEPPAYFLQDGANQLEVLPAVMAGCVLHEVALSDEREKLATVCRGVALFNGNDGRIGRIDNQRFVFFGFECEY